MPGQFHILELGAFEVIDFAAPDAAEMLVMGYVGVESFRPAVAGDHIGKAQFGYSRQCAIDRIERNFGIFFSHLLENHSGRGMLFGAEYMLVNRYPL